ncbi:MAG: 4Fe-4S dicluster domain-containing protein [Leptospirales bacterium]|nr:4Fe-4S dicluster domain-containing protein [Leptospirales bacterium]
MSAVSYENVSDAVYDPNEPGYWDSNSLQRELVRNFDLCNGCRMCFKLCPSFPTLFSAMDATDNDAHQLSEAKKEQVLDECFQCKLCYVICPYTATDKHPYNIDYPALMERYRLQKAKRDGIGLREKALQNPDFLGRVNTGMISRVANAAMNSNFHRSIMQGILGIHKSKKMPEFHRTSFMQWFRKRAAARTPAAGAGPRVALFATCFVNYNNPRVGKDAVEVLEKSGVRVECPEQNCCGMPALDSGDLKFALKKMKRNIDSLTPYVEQGYKILAINPTCSLTLKKKYAQFMPPGELQEKARALGAATMDLHEYLFELKKRESFNREFLSLPGKVAYHVPCHLRAQNIGFRSRDLMKLIPGAQISPVTECCGHDGTWAMKEEFFEPSLEAGRRAFEGLKAQDAAVVATDCPLAAIQLEQGMELKMRPLHPVQVLARAYKSPEEGGWPMPAVKEQQD